MLLKSTNKLPIGVGDDNRASPRKLGPATWGRFSWLLLRVPPRKAAKMTYPQQGCCTNCAGLGDAPQGSTFLGSQPSPMLPLLLALGIAGAAFALVKVVAPKRRRPRRHYVDPDDRGLHATQRLPRESMRDIVFERRR